jgi:hypothetical protein
VYPHQHGLVAGHVTAHEREVGLAVERAQERVTTEVTPHRRHSCVGDVFDELLVASAVPHQVGDRHERQTVFVGEAPQVVTACHLATVEHEFAQHACGRASCESGQVDRRFGVPDALEHAAGASAQWEDVARTVERRSIHVGVRERPQRRRTIRRRDPRRGSLGEIDADREGSAVRLGVLRRDHHRLQAEFVAALAGEADADHPRGVPHEEGDRLGRRCVGGHDQVAFVLAVLVVGDDDDLAAGDRSNGVLDRIEHAGHRVAGHRVAPVST